MRISNSFGALALSASLLGGCGAEEAEAEAPLPEVAQQVPTSVEIEAPAPAHGGTVVTAGDQLVEVVPQEDGNVRAYVVTAEPPPPEQTRITVRMPGDDGRTHPVVLTYDPDEQRYHGRLRRARPVAGPVEVVMVVGAERYEGRAPQVVVIAPPAPPSPVVHVERPAAPATTVIVEEPRRPQVDVVVHRPEPPRPTIVIERPEPPRPTIVVHHPTPPRPTVVVHAPGPPRPSVVVHAPGPPRPGVVVHAPGPRVHVHGDRGRHRGKFRGRGRGHGRH